MHNNGQYYLLFRFNNSLIELSKGLHTELYKQRLERAIGVIYRPHTERQSHYFNASISTQFDRVIHIEGTRALKPLESIQHGQKQKKNMYQIHFPMNV